MAVLRQLQGELRRSPTRRPPFRAVLAGSSGTVARRRRFITAASVSLALLAAGCATATNELHPGREQLAAASKASLGTVLVDDEGRTVYLFEKDPPNRSTCDGACASVWPPLTTNGQPQAGEGVAAGKLTTIQRSDGLLQVVYAGHPLYYYQADTDSEDAHGQEVRQFGAEWYAVTAAGEGAGESGSEGGNGGGGDGGGY